MNLDEGNFPSELDLRPEVLPYMRRVNLRDMQSATLKRLVSDTERGLSQKKDAVTQNMEDVTSEGKTGNARVRAVQPTEALKVFFDRIPLQLLPGLDNIGVVEVQAEQTIEESMRLLHKQEVLGAPVVDNPKTSEMSMPVSDQYIGLVEFGSMVLWALEEIEAAETQAQIRGLMVEKDSEDKYEKAETTPAGSLVDDDGQIIGVSTAALQDNEDFWSILKRLDGIGNSKVGALARSFRLGPFLPVYPDDSLLHVLLLLSKHSLKAAPVVDPKENKVTGFITQDAAMQLLLQCSGLSWFDMIAQKELHLFGFQVDPPAGQLVSIQGDKPLSEAFHCLWNYRLSAVPVIDSKTKKLIGTVRSADTRMLIENNELFRGRRTITINEFMEADSPKDEKEDRPRSVLEEDLGAAISAATLTLGVFKLPRMKDPVTCRPKDTLKDTIRRLVSARSDRSFMIDDNMHLIGVVTLRDIMTQFSPPLGEESDRWGDLFDNALSI